MPKFELRMMICFLIAWSNSGPIAIVQFVAEYHHRFWLELIRHLMNSWL